MRAFWDDCGRGVAGDDAQDVDLEGARRLWSDLSGVRGNFLGLIDGEGRTIQFCFTDDVPDDREDARALAIVLADIPDVGRGGSYAAQVRVGDVHRLIERAFGQGADHRRFAELAFAPW